MIDDLLKQAADELAGSMEKLMEEAKKKQDGWKEVLDKAEDLETFVSPAHYSKNCDHGMIMTAELVLLLVKLLKPDESTMNVDISKLVSEIVDGDDNK